MQGDLFPETKKQGYIDVDFCDLTEPSFRITEASTFYAQQGARRIDYLLSLPKERYYIFRNEKGDPDSLPYIVDNKRGKRITISSTRNLYPAFALGGKMLYMHTIVALFFLVNDMPQVKLVVDHKDGDTFNYRVKNLQWISHSDNIRRRNTHD